MERLNSNEVKKTLKSFRCLLPTINSSPSHSPVAPPSSQISGVVDTEINRVASKQTGNASDYQIESVCA